MKARYKPRAPALLNFNPVPIADQAATVMREAIHRGVWGAYLPGGRELASQLGISRPTLYSAFSILAKGGLIEINRGSRTRILSRNCSRNLTRTVCTVSSISRRYVGLDESLLSSISRRLISRGIGWEEVFDMKLNGTNSACHLAKLVAGRRQTCWLIFAGSAGIQGWFANAGLPAMVLGSCFPGVRLPSVDRDYRAVGRHAAGSMTRLGHRHIALIIKEHPLPGDLACRDGFADYLREYHDENSLTVISAGLNAFDLQAKLRRMLTHCPRPTVVFSMNPEHAQTALTYLPYIGMNIPRDISVISGETHGLFETSTPELSRYRTAIGRMVSHTVRVLHSMMQGHAVSPRPYLVTPTFIAGKTLSQPPSGPGSLVNILNPGQEV